MENKIEKKKSIRIVFAVADVPWKFRLLQDVKATLHHLYGMLLDVRHHIRSDPWAGIPELTNENGQYCRDSPIQTNRPCDCSDSEHCQATDYYIEELETVLNSTVPKKIAAFFLNQV